MTHWWAFEIRPWWARLVVGRRPVVTLVRLAVVVALAFVVLKVFVVPIRVTGHSMEPSYQNGQRRYVNRASYWLRDPGRLDVVGIRKEDSISLVLKRLVALPGERVRVWNGRVVVNGLPLDEPYARGRGIPETRGDILLGDGEYFAIGDNRSVTLYDVVRRGEILGRVWR